MATSGRPTALSALPSPTTPEPLASSLPLAQRIGHAAPSTFRQLSHVHSGPGSMSFTSVLNTTALSTNFIFLHRGVIAPHSGIGAHFHHQCEEMFVILDPDSEAQFTIDGRTSVIKGPVGVPCGMGHSHAIYNHTDKPLQWLNVNVGMSKVYDAFDLGDSRTEGMVLDKVPQFVTMKLEKTMLQEVPAMDGGRGMVSYRRALKPTVFNTTWAWVDHLVVKEGSTVGERAWSDVSEVYVVMDGYGEIWVDGECVVVKKDDAVPVDLGQARSITASGVGPLEFLIIGVAKDMEVKRALNAGPPPST